MLPNSDISKDGKSTLAAVALQIDMCKPAPRRDSDSEDDPDLTPALPLAPHVRYSPPRRSDAELVQRSGEFHELMARRRTVRAFSAEEIPREVLENVVRTAGRS
ncbi:unnamed protein product [Plutella xylostella]|uniref:(diamondback moth) hypothetical protein n=1 Tax=Plutella xylostella TaxID=51655 RepID=A0A8S4EWQ1_PLUXY|nr:unnamed protein product [Plutella xylostella]